MIEIPADENESRELCGHLVKSWNGVPQVRRICEIGQDNKFKIPCGAGRSEGGECWVGRVELRHAVHFDVQVVGRLGEQSAQRNNCRKVACNGCLKITGCERRDEVRIRAVDNRNCGGRIGTDENVC